MFAPSNTRLALAARSDMKGLPRERPASFINALYAGGRYGIDAAFRWLLGLEEAMAKKTMKLDKAMGKGEILTELAASTELPKKDVARVIDALAALIERHIAKKSVGTFTLPGLLKVKTIETPARPARKGVPNPFRPGETMDVAARPARRKVKVLPLKKLKAMIG
jgi:nucleoid DNA-binding protein